MIRVAVLDRKRRGPASIKAKIKIPLIADIHFDHRLALESIKAGCDG
jgi:(E)-4-hydroxy-3-methylbut-2-enyl-diphosphate synthase